MDDFVYGFIKTQNGLKMLTNWGFPQINLNDPILTLGARIKALRLKKGLNQEDLAKNSGSALSILSRYEQGKILDFNPWILEKIANPLNVEPLELLPKNNQAEFKDLYDYFCRRDTLWVAKSKIYA